MCTVKISNLFMLFFFVLVYVPSFEYAIGAESSMGVEIKGEVDVHRLEADAWSKYIGELEISLSGEITGETAENVNSNNSFSFKDVNPKDIVRILWLHDESTKSIHVLYPYDNKGKAATLSQGVIRFRFRKMDWVLKKLKDRASAAANEGDIQEIDEIVKHARNYHDALSNSKNVEKLTIDRYMHKLLQHICQKSAAQRSADNEVFDDLENVSVDRKWYVDLLNTVSDSQYEKAYPAALVRALNDWVIFSRQAYTKYDRWSDRDMPFSGELDPSFRSDKVRELLLRDVIKIFGILERSSNEKLKGHPFNEDGPIDMNKVSNWIAEINRNVKPLPK